MTTRKICNKSMTHTFAICLYVDVLFSLTLTLVILFFSSVQIKEPAELMTHESSTIRGHHNIGIHPEDRGMGPYSSYGMHTLFSFTYSLLQLRIIILCNPVFWNAFVFYGEEGDHVSELRSSFLVGHDHHYTYLYMSIYIIKYHG